MKQENKTFTQFSERLANLNLRSTTHRNKNNDESNDDNQPSALESLLEQLKKQTNAVKETLSHRSPTTNFNQDTFQSSTIDNNKKNLIKENPHIIPNTTNKLPIVQSIKIEDDLTNELLQSNKDLKDIDGIIINDNNANSLPLSSTILANSSVQENLNNNANASVNVNVNVNRQSSINSIESLHCSQLNPNPDQVIAIVNEPKKKIEQNLRTSKDNLIRSRDDSGKKGDNNSNGNPMVVDVVESEGSEDEEDDELDYYSKSIKRTNNTNNIHDIPEEKGESDEEDETAREAERQRIEREQKEKEEKEKKIAEEKRKREEESAAERKRKEEMVAIKKRRKEEAEQKKKEEMEAIKKKQQQEELEKKKKKKKQREDEAIAEQKEERELNTLKTNNKNNKSKKLNANIPKAKETIEVNKPKDIIDNQPAPEYFDIQIEDIDDIPELPIAGEPQNTKPKSSKKPSTNAVNKKQSKNNIPKEQPEPKPKPNDSDVDDEEAKANKKKSTNEIKKRENLNSPKKAKDKAKPQSSFKMKDAEDENKGNTYLINPQRIRERIIKEMNEFDITNPDLDREFILLRNFEGKDRNLTRIIPDYQQVIIEHEGNKIFLQRRKAFLDHSFFKMRFIEDESHNDFIIYLQKLPNPYPKAILSNYNQLPDKSDIFPKTYNYSNADLFHYSPKLGSSPIISGIENISTFVYQYSLNLYPNLVETAISAFSHWRKPKCDGNSFYRVIMFSITEQLVLNKDIDGIKMLISEFTRLNDYYKEKKIDLEPAMIVFKLITDELSNENIDKAYELLCKAYNNMKNDSFDKTLIFYLRNIASQYIKDTYMLIEQEVKKTNAKLDKSYFMNHMAVLENHIEPESDIIHMIKYLFNIDIELFWMEGLFDNPSFGFSKLTNKSKVNNDDTSNNEHCKFNIGTTIRIGYFFSSYFILYPNKEQVKSVVLKEKMNEGIASFTQLLYIEKTKKTCGSCGRQASKIYFLVKLFYTCTECLRDYMDRVLTDRAKAFILSNFVGFECKSLYSNTELDYTKDIQLNNDYYISQYDFIEINESEETIAERLLNTVLKLCFECGEYLTKDKSSANRKELKCKCCYCVKCLLEKQLKATNGFKYINQYEKLKFVKVPCACNHSFDPLDAQKYCTEITDEDIKNSKERMIRYISTMCFVCVKPFQIQSDSSAGSELISITVLADNSSSNINSKVSKEDDYCLIPHMICSQCYLAEKAKLALNHSPTLSSNAVVNTQQSDKEESQKERDIKVNRDDVIIIRCNICRKKHNTDRKSWNFKESQVCCNTGDCIIY